ncbi:MAG: 4-hydroxy-tetrahydrodipicolinate synthase [Immundisolibacter sp.]
MIHGSVVALVTPMTASGAVDYAALARLVEFHVEAGTHGIVAVGTTGESPTLDMDEHIGVIAEVVRRVDGRMPVIGGTGANATAEAIELTRAAADVGVDACLLVTPYYNKPTQEGLYRHFLAVAQAVSIPQILYNVPGRTACDMRTETVLRLAEVPNIVGLKDATGSIERGAELLAACADDFWLFSGDDAVAAELMLRGYRGVISVTANVAPKAMAAMSEAALAGRREQALALDAPLQALHRDLFVEANPIPVKWALAEMELIEAGIRLPLTPLSASHHAAVRAALRQAAVL